MLNKIKIYIYSWRIKVYHNLFANYSWYRKLAKLLSPKKRLINRAGFIALFILVGGYGFFAYYQDISQAEIGRVSSLGRGIVVYGKSSNTTPQSRQLASGGTTFGTEIATVSSIQPVQVVTKTNPVKPNEVIAVVQNTALTPTPCDTNCKIEVLKSDDFGNTWTSILSQLIGENGVARRFDIAYEQLSGELVLAYANVAGDQIISFRTYDGTSWSSQGTSDLSNESTHKIVQLELTEKPNSNEIALAYLTNRSTTNNIGAAIWNGSNAFTNSMRMQTTPPGGMCDYVNTSHGGDKCYDIVYESASGKPTLIWGIQALHNAGNTVIINEFDGTNWSANITLNLEDDATILDCEANPAPMSDEIACISWGQGANGAGDATPTAIGQVQSWTIKNGALGVANLNIDTTARDRGSGNNDVGALYVAMTYLSNGGNYRFVGAYADGNSTPTNNKLSITSFDGSTWTNSANVINLGTTVDIVNSYKFSKNFGNSNEAVLLFQDNSNQLNGSLITFDGSSINSEGLTEVTTSLSGGAILPAYDFVFDSTKAPSKLTQSAYIWENDDSTSADGASQLVPANTAFTARKGERLNLRTQIKNSGGPIENDNLSLFYDKGDGIWNKVSSGAKTVGLNNSTLPWETVSGGCDNQSFKCTTIESANDTGYDSAISIGPDGVVWAIYRDETTQSIKASKYVGSGGTGCGATSEWTCSTIEDTTTASYSDHMALAVDSYGKPWGAYIDKLNGGLKVAKYVGSGGTGCVGGGSEWQCDRVDITANTGDFASIAIKDGNKPWITYKSGGKVNLARYVGSGGSGCNVSTWTCTTLATFTNIGFTSLAINDNGDTWASFHEQTTAGTNEDLYVAKYVGSGGTGCGGPTDWTCYSVDSSNTSVVGYGNSITIDDSGNPWVSYMDETNYRLKVARFVGLGLGRGCDSTSGGAWFCEEVAINLCATGATNFCTETSINKSKDGQIYVTYKDNDGLLNDGLYYAYYSGETGGVGCFSARWTCNAIEYNLDPGFDATSILDKNGSLWVAHKNGNNDFMVYKMVNNWQEININDIGKNSYFAVDNFGRPFMTYNETSTSLEVAQFIGSNGTCIATAFNCSRILNNTGEMKYTSIAFDKGNRPWVSFMDSGATQLVASRYVGTGGNSSNGRWKNQGIGAAQNSGYYSNIKISPDGTPFVIFGQDNGASPFKMMIGRYVGQGGSGCGGLLTNWDCHAIASDSTKDYVDTTINYRAGLAFGNDGSIWTAFSEVGSDDLMVAQYVGSGGTGCGSNTTGLWNCTAVVTSNSVDKGISLAIGPDGVTPYLVYKDNTTSSLNIAKYVGSGGNCNSTGWTCTVIDDHVSNNIANFTDLAFDPSGTPWIAYTNDTNSSLKIAKYVGGSSQSSCGTGSSAWSCTVVSDVLNLGSSNVNISFGSDGTVYASALDNNNTTGDATDDRLRLFVLKSSNHLVSAPSIVANASAVSETHTDMTTITDTVNRDDADCIGGGTFVSGAKFSTTGTSDYIMPGNFIGTDSCTEVSFTLDTSQSQEGVTYRFVVATDDEMYSNKAIWRGPAQIDNYATLSISPVTDSKTMYTKDTIQDWPDCEGTTDGWQCTTLINGTDIFGNGPIRMATNPDGNLWVLFNADTDAGQPYPDDLWVAKYVGTGGSGCTGSDISSAWECTKIEGTGNYVAQDGLDIAIGKDGMVWVAYQDKTNLSLKVAKYVGTGGSGCSDTNKWSCSTVDDGSSNSNFAYGVDITIDPISNNPYIAYEGDNGTAHDTKLARYVGNDGTGCINSAWECKVIQVPPTNAVAYDRKVLMSPSGLPIVALPGDNNNKLTTAMFVEENSSLACNGSNIPNSWKCEDSTANAGINYGGEADIALNTNNNPIMALRNSEGSDAYLGYSEYVGGIKGRPCQAVAGSTTTGWNCVRINKSTGNTYMARSVSLTTDSSNRPNIVYGFGDEATANISKLLIARYVGTGGSGCSETSSWSCATLYDASVGGGASVGICDGKGLESVTSSNGTMFVAFHKGDSLGCNTSTNSAGDIIIAMRKPNYQPLKSQSNLTNAEHGVYRSNGKYSLTPGRSGNNYEKCLGNTDYFGYCGLFDKDGLFDSIAVNAYEQPVYNMTWQYKDVNEGFGVYWAGRSGLAPNSASSTGDISLQVYRYGTTNAWETLVTDSSSADCSTVTCTLSGSVSSNLSEYLNGNPRDGYWVQARVIQKSGTSGFTFKTDTLSIQKTADYLRGGASFREGQERSLDW